ncbi:GGDEF domain-containing protein [Clostridium botulinum]|nr:GGDEF domain-containing protein [Clostridium botulinum]NFS54317.1 GGDEF domain-containing protein [Clostridium botulinum]NFT16978.1 GGDEF domain-containing protein [Clostridium botulinum]
MKQFKKQYVVILLVIIGINIIGVVYFLNKYEQNKKAGELNELMKTFVVDDNNNEKEISDMKDFISENPNLDRRNIAKFNLNLTKLYILDLFDWGNLDDAIDSFVKTQIESGLSKQWDIAAWSYADISQIYIDFYTYDIAEECLERALNYASRCEMEEFFYEYCYTTLAMIYARTNRSDLAMDYYNKALEYDSEDRVEYESMEQRRKIVLSRILLNEKKYDECKKNLNEIREYIHSYETYPSRILWVSGILFPYLEIQAKVGLLTQDYDGLIHYMDEMFTYALIYNQNSILLNFLTDIATMIDKENIVDLPVEVEKAISNYTLKLIRLYPEEYQLRNIQTGAHMYNSNETNITLLIQKYKVNDLYKIIITVSCIVVIVIIILVLMVRYNERSSVIDEVSKSYNRRYFNKIYKKIQREKVPFGILMYDIDYFKQINDCNGHEVGDKVITEISEIIMELLDSNSTLFRYGGDEFCIISKKRNLDEMISLAELIHIVTDHMKCADGKVEITLSIGGATTENSKDIMSLVDDNLYEAKRRGRNCTVVKNKKIN